MGLAWGKRDGSIAGRGRYARAGGESIGPWSQRSLFGKTSENHRPRIGDSTAGGAYLHGMNIEQVGKRAAFLGGLAVAALVIGVGACDVMDGATLTGAKDAWVGSAPIPAGTWRLVSLHEAGEPAADLGAATFTAEFGADARLSLTADCNRCSAVYEAGDRSLRVGVLACTRAYCAASAPLDTTYTNLVDSARTWSIGADGRLELTSAAGTLRFAR